MSYLTYLLLINYIVGQILLAIPQTLENKNRIAFAIIVHLFTTLALLITVGKELWVDFTRKK
jgi:hypothetical protein